jgi:HlyD family secretion protein
MGLTVCLLTSCGPTSTENPTSITQKQSDGADVPKVTTVKPVRKRLARRTEQPGQIEAFAETAVFAKVSGYVDRVLVDIGDKVAGPQQTINNQLVKSGQTLAVLSVPELDEELKQKAALLEQSKSEVEQAVASISVAVAAKESAESLIKEAQASEARAEASYQRWKSESERITSLVEKKVMTEKVAEETILQFKSADAARGETAARIMSTKSKLAESQAQIKKVQADHQTALAKQHVAEADLGRVAALCQYKTITAPFDGVVTTRNIDPGHLAHASQGVGGKPLFVVVQAHKVRVFIDVPEADAVAVEQSREAKVRVPGLAGQVFKGEVARTAWALNSVTRTLKVEIDIPNANGHLRPGMYAYVDLLISEKADALVLPKGAIHSGEGGTSCLAVDSSGKIVKHAVKIGLKAGNEVEITEGLTEQEDVIAVNTAALQPGQQVERVPTK